MRSMPINTYCAPCHVHAIPLPSHRADQTESKTTFKILQVKLHSIKGRASRGSCQRRCHLLRTLQAAKRHPHQKVRLENVSTHITKRELQSVHRKLESLL